MADLETDKMDDIEWMKLFIQLTGGYGDVVTENRSRTNLSNIDETEDDSENRRVSISTLSTPQTCQKLTCKRKSVDDKMPPPGSGDPRMKSRLSLPTLPPAPRLSLTDTDRLLDAKKRSIEVEKLEKYILGKKSVELEIEFGIPRSQLCR